MSVWCVRHRDGWCATSAQKPPPNEKDDQVRTRCRHFVVLPWGFERRSPTCPECVKALKKPEIGKP